MRRVRQWLAKRRLVQLRNRNLERLHTTPKRDAWGRFTNERKSA